MTLARPWLAHYPAGVPHEIDPDAFPSVVAVLQSAIAQYRDRPAFSSLGRQLTYGEVDALSRRFAAFLLGDLGLKQGDRILRSPTSTLIDGQRVELSKAAASAAAPAMTSASGTPPTGLTNSGSTSTSSGSTVVPLPVLPVASAASAQ